LIAALTFMRFRLPVGIAYTLISIAAMILHWRTEGRRFRRTGSRLAALAVAVVALLAELTSMN
jgi:hypothetical protein